MIFEIAKVKCGGKDELEAAMRRGQVRAHGNVPGQELYYFPRASVGGERTWESEETMERQQHRTADDFEGFGTVVDSFMSISNNGQGDLAQMCSFASGSSTLSGISIGSSSSQSLSMDALRATMMTELERLSTAIKVADKATEKVTSRGNQSVKIADTLAHLLTKTEEAETIKARTQFMMKFKKSVEHEPMTETMARTQLVKLKESSFGICEDCKILKALGAYG